jgi:hypothetical protein
LILGLVVYLTVTRRDVIEHHHHHHHHQHKHAHPPATPVTETT